MAKYEISLYRNGVWGPWRPIRNKGMFFGHRVADFGPADGVRIRKAVWYL